MPQTGNTFQWADNYSKIVGTHSFKFGGDVRYQKFDQLLYFDVNSQIIFNSNPNLCPPPSQAQPASCTAVSGNDLGYSSPYPDYFLGLASSNAQGSAQH